MQWAQIVQAQAKLELWLSTPDVAKPAKISLVPLLSPSFLQQKQEDPISSISLTFSKSRLIYLNPKNKPGPLCPSSGSFYL